MKEKGVLEQDSEIFKINNGEPDCRFTEGGLRVQALQISEKELYPEEWICRHLSQEKPVTG